jgi:hypothetical protein
MSEDLCLSVTEEGGAKLKVSLVMVRRQTEIEVSVVYGSKL